MKCYGTYSKHKEGCLTCADLAWCKEAADPKPSAELSFENIEYAEDFSTTKTPLEILCEKEKDKTDLILSSLATCIRSMIVLKTKHPKTFRYVMLKIENPSISYREMARRFGVKHQNCDYHIRRACHVFKELRCAILLDRRFLPKSRSLDAQDFYRGEHEEGNSNRSVETA